MADIKKTRRGQKGARLFMCDVCTYVRTVQQEELKEKKKRRYNMDDASYAYSVELYRAMCNILSTENEELLSPLLSFCFSRFILHPSYSVLPSILYIFLFSFPSPLIIFICSYPLCVYVCILKNKKERSRPPLQLGASPVVNVARNELDGGRSSFFFSFSQLLLCLQLSIPSLLISEGINKRLPVRLAIFYDPLSDACFVLCVCLYTTYRNERKNE